MTTIRETAREAGRGDRGDRGAMSRADQYEEKMASPYQRLLREITWAHILKQLPRRKDSLVLDACGATGFWSMRLAQAGYRVVLVDDSAELLAAARERIAAAGLSGRIEAVESDIADLREWNEGTFDAAIAVEEPISFSRDPEMAVAEMALVTKSGGMVAVAGLNRFKARDFERFLRKGDIEGLTAYLESGQSPAADDAGTGALRKAFSPDELESMLAANGLEVVSAIGKPIFASAVGGQLADRETFSRILRIELANNANRSLWGTADVVEIIATKA